MSSQNNLSRHGSLNNQGSLPSINSNVSNALGVSSGSLANLVSTSISSSTAIAAAYPTVNGVAGYSRMEPEQIYKTKYDSVKINSKGIYSNVNENKNALIMLETIKNLLIKNNCFTEEQFVEEYDGIELHLEELKTAKEVMDKLTEPPKTIDRRDDFSSSYVYSPYVSLPSLADIPSSAGIPSSQISGNMYDEISKRISIELNKSLKHFPGSGSI